MNQAVELTEWHNRLLNELLLVVPSHFPWDDAMAGVEARLEAAKNNRAWQGAQITIDVGGRPVPPTALAELVERLKATLGMLTVAVVATDHVTREAARALALNTYLMLPGGSVDSAREVGSDNNALYIPQTLRSGQRIVHSGHVVIGGDVNPGAEVIAEGDILVVGTLRGIAHAGSQGNEAACITAGNMRPQLVRIAAQIARAPEETTGRANPGQRFPEVARIENGVIQVSPV